MKTENDKFVMYLSDEIAADPVLLEMLQRKPELFKAIMEAADFADRFLDLRQQWLAHCEAMVIAIDPNFTPDPEPKLPTVKVM